MTSSKGQDRRARKRAARKAAIVDATVEVLRQEGYDQLTIQAVADVADYTPGALYRYFDSKDALMAAVVLQVLEELSAVTHRSWALLEERAEEDSPRALQSLLHLWSMWPIYLSFSQVRGAKMEAFVAMLGTPQILLPAEAQAQPVAQAALALLFDMAGKFDDAMSCGALSEGQGLARAFLLWSSTHGLVERRKLLRGAPQEVDLAPLGEELCRSLFIGWGASRELLDLCQERHEALWPELREHMFVEDEAE